MDKVIGMEKEVTIKCIGIVKLPSRRLNLTSVTDDSYNNVGQRINDH